MPLITISVRIDDQPQQEELSFLAPISPSNLKQDPVIFSSWLHGRLQHVYEHLTNTLSEKLVPSKPTKSIEEIEKGLHTSTTTDLDMDGVDKLAHKLHKGE